MYYGDQNTIKAPSWNENGSWMPDEDDPDWFYRESGTPPDIDATINFNLFQRNVYGPVPPEYRCAGCDSQARPEFTWSIPDWVSGMSE